MEFPLQVKTNEGLYELMLEMGVEYVDVWNKEQGFNKIMPGDTNRKPYHKRLIDYLKKNSQN